MRASAHWGQVDPFSMYNGTADGSDAATCCRSRDKWRLRMKLVRGVCVHYRFPRKEQENQAVFRRGQELPEIQKHL